MSRPLRILVAGGWYHVVNRGQRRERIFHTDDDRRRFLGLVAVLPDRFGVEIHAFVLMDNHYHLLVRTPEPNLSHAIRWLQVSYASRFNWAHRTVGHLFQGRFKAQILQDEGRVVRVARYLHLNPVRVGGLGLGKEAQRRTKRVGGKDPGAELVRRRLAQLAQYAWSSWRVYSGEEFRPAWLETGVIEAGCGGRSRTERRRALREYTESPVREGRLEDPWEGLVGSVMLGDLEWAQRLLKENRGAGDVQAEVRRIERGVRPGWERIVRASEGILGRSWEAMMRGHGDWGRDGTMYVAVRFLRYRLVEVVRQIKGLRYATAVQGIKRFAAAEATDAERQRFVKKLRSVMSHVLT